METSAKLGMPSARPFITDGGEPLFVIKQRDLFNVANREVLANLGVDRHTTANFEEESVYAFTAAELKILLAGIGAVVIERFGSAKPKIEWIRLATQDELTRTFAGEFEADEPIPAYPVEIQEWKRAHQDAFAYLASRLIGPAIGRKILLNAAEQSTVADYDDRGGFQIRIWSTACYGAREGDTPRYLWGTYVDGRHGALKPEPAEIQGIPIMDGDYMVAELYPNALLVHHDLAYDGSTGEIKIMKALCDKVARILKDKETFATRLQEAKRRFEDEQSKIFSALVRRSIPERAVRYDEELEPARRRVSSLRSQLFEAQRELFSLEHARIDPAAVAAKFSAEIAKFQRGEVANIERVAFAGTMRVPKLHLYTSEIVATDSYDGQRYLLGRYRIVVDFTDGSIRFFNLDRIVDECHGPHIFSDGKACLGNIEDDMREYIAHYEVEAIATFAVAFLQSPNTADGEGKRVREYPLFNQENGEQDAEE